MQPHSYLDHELAMSVSELPINVLTTIEGLSKRAAVSGLKPHTLDPTGQSLQKRMPGNMMNHLTNVQKIYYVAVDHENDGVFGYKDHNGEVWHWEANAIKTKYPALYGKLNDEKPSGVSRSDISLVFGPGSYATCFPTVNGAHWLNIHSRCKFRVEENNRVRHVALGVDNDFIVLYEGSGFYYAVETNYPILDSILDNVEAGTTITFVALNPWVAGQFFLILDNDTAFFAVNPSLEDEVAEILREQGIVCNALVKYNPTRTVAKRKPAINVKNKDFMKELLGHAFGGSVGAVVGSVITGMSSCSVM
ncbi:hypothetical protein CDV31_014471 [Fusarium ambrosium]|uniref:Uncharacterized protein n=1 Tax=Fusarium ambrosium TaxID=131363 RepID=A0A428SW93_9HYPO|nr:hypothetical protein CDV31_014471 [Fusarium ambrosium]